MDAFRGGLVFKDHRLCVSPNSRLESNKEEEKMPFDCLGFQSVFSAYMGTSLIRKHTPLGPYRRPMPRVLGGWAFSYGRGTPVTALSVSGGSFRAGSGFEG